jgi:hypothetical protein
VVAHVCGGKLPPGGLHDAVDRGEVVIRRLHRPDFVPLRAEGFGGLGFNIQDHIPCRINEAQASMDSTDSFRFRLCENAEGFSGMDWP